MTKKVDGAVRSDRVVAKGKKWVTRQFRKEDSSEETELEARVFEVEPAWVRAGYGLTVNMGNYESARCDAGVTLPCYVEEIGVAFDEAWKVAEEEVQEQVRELKRG
jgi:hypothetical protein